jgi:hypothetical protein
MQGKTSCETDDGIRLRIEFYFDFFHCVARTRFVFPEHDSVIGGLYQHGMSTLYRNVLYRSGSVNNRLHFDRSHQMHVPRYARVHGHHPAGDFSCSVTLLLLCERRHKRQAKSSRKDYE